MAEHGDGLPMAVVAVLVASPGWRVIRHRRIDGLRAGAGVDPLTEVIPVEAIGLRLDPSAYAHLSAPSPTLAQWTELVPPFTAPALYGPGNHTTDLADGDFIVLARPGESNGEAIERARTR